MKISEIMSPEVQRVEPGQSLKEAACLMAACDVGALPVQSGDRLVGMITDRDIAIRGVATGMGPQARVEEVMSPEVLYCYEDQELDEVVDNMADIQVRRLPVLNSLKRLVGIVALGDLAGANARRAAKAVAGVSRPGGEHSQSGSR